MSVALESAPWVVVPERARSTSRGGRPLASVSVLHRPSEASVAPPLRLTRRGVMVVAALVAALACAVVAVAAACAPSASRSDAEATGPATVTVRAGDTLWSIAARVAPARDPRQEVDALQRINHLAAADLVAGQVLRTR